MRIEYIIDSYTKAKSGVLNQGKGKVHPKEKNVSGGKFERLSEWDIKELMGMFEPTFKKRRGVWRSK